MYSMYCKFCSYTYYILLLKKNPLQVTTTITITIIFPQKGRTASLGQQHISSPSLVHILCQSERLVFLRPKTVLCNVLSTILCKYPVLFLVFGLVILHEDSFFFEIWWESFPGNHEGKFK